MIKKSVFMALALSLVFAGSPEAARTSDIKPDKALEEAVKIELQKRTAEKPKTGIEERELPDPAKESDQKLMEEARAAVEAQTREFEKDDLASAAKIEEEQGAPIEDGEAATTKDLETAVSAPFGESIKTGREGKNPDLSREPQVTMYPKGYEAFAPNDAAINPGAHKIDYYIFTTALDRQKWRSNRLDPNIGPFIDKYVDVHVIPSAPSASSLAYIFNHIADMGEKRKALGLLDWAYEHGRNVITIPEVDAWLLKNGLPETGAMKIDPDMLKKLLHAMNGQIANMTSLDAAWSPSRKANWHDGVVFVDSQFDPELFMRVYGEANPEKAKNFLEPHERQPAGK